MVLKVSSTVIKSKKSLNFFKADLKLRPIEKLPSLQKIYELKIKRDSAILEMQERYPHIKSKYFRWTIGYSLQRINPWELVQHGGINTQNALWVSNARNGENYGSICLSVLPEVCTLFQNSKSSFYLYAFPLNGLFFLPGGPWRQVISPGAFPLPLWWVARQLLGIENQKIILGDLIGQTHESMGLCHNEKHWDYLANRLMQPKGYYQSEDYPSNFDIKDTELSKEIQEFTQTSFEKSYKIR